MSTSAVCAGTSMPTASATSCCRRLVRGLDYYTRTTFEFKDEAIGAKDTICGGGRYDGLIEEIGGPPTPGIGFGAGIERLLLSIGSERAEPPHIDVFFVCEQDGDRARIVPLLAELRRRGLRADMDYAGRSTKGQLNQAARLGAAGPFSWRAGRQRSANRAAKTSPRRSTQLSTGSQDEPLARPLLRRGEPRARRPELTWPGGSRAVAITAD